MELVALYNPGGKQGGGYERAAAGQRNLLSAALGGWLSVASLSNISGTGISDCRSYAFWRALVPFASQVENVVSLRST